MADLKIKPLNIEPLGNTNGLAIEPLNIEPIDDKKFNPLAVADATADFITGIPKMLAAGAGTIAAKISHPSYNLDELWKAANQTVDESTPGFGKINQTLENPGYTVPMWPIEKYGQVVEGIGNVAGNVTGSPDVAGGVKMAGAFAPLPFAGKVGKLLSLRDKVPAESSRLSALDEGLSKRLPEETPLSIEPIAPEKQMELPLSNSVEDIAREQNKQTPQMDMFVEPPPKEAPVIPPEVIKQQEIEQAYQQKAQQELVAQKVQELRDKWEGSVPKGQRGAINVEDVKAAIDYFKQGFVSAKDVLNSYKGAFYDKELSDMRRALDDPKSRDTVVLMNPDDFLSVAAPRISSVDTAERQFAVRVALQGQKGLADIPYLRLDENGKVEAHEGRHRMDVFKQQGIDLVPVRIRSSDVRWGEIPERWPTEIKGERTDVTLPLPEPLTNRFVVPRSQRGGVDINAIGEKLKGLVSRTAVPEGPISTPKSSSVHDAIKSVPGNETVGKDYIPNYPSVQEILKEVLPEKDSNIKWTGVQSGATLTGAKYHSSLISKFGDLYQTAQKKAELNIRTFVQPTEWALKKLKPQQRIDLWGVLKRAMLERSPITVEDLQKAGFTPKEIDAYTLLREAQENAFTKQNNRLEALGKKPMTHTEYYLTSRWGGDWRTPIYGKDGKLLWYVAERNKWAAKAALDFLAKNVPDIDVSKSKVEFVGDKQRTRGPVEDAYRTMLSMLDPKDPRTETLQSIAEEAMAKDAFNTLGQSRHFENKANIRGFEGDKPWKTAHENALDGFQQQFQYLKNAFTWTEMSKATEIGKEVLSNPDIVKDQPNNLAYAQRYAKEKIGFGENKNIAGLEADVMKQLGLSKSYLNNAVGGFKTLFIVTKLGFNSGFYIAQQLQPFIVTPSWHADLSAQGFKHNPFKTLISAGMDTASGYMKYKFGADMPMTEIGRKGLKYAEDNGIVSRDVYDEAAQLGAHPVTEAVQGTVGTVMKEIEHETRLGAFMSFLHHLDQSGKFKDDVMGMFKKAEDYTNMSMVDYRSGERPMMFTAGGSLTSSASTLQTYKFNYYNTLHHFFKEAVDGHPQGFITFAGMQLLVGGALSFPFVTDAQNIWEKIKDISPPEILHKYQDFNIKSTIIKHMGDLMAFGGVSKLTGANMTGRFDPGTVADYSMDSLFPAYMDILHQGKAVSKFIRNPNSTTASEAAYGITPPGSLQGNLETRVPTFQNGKTKEGNTVYMSPKNLDQHDASFVRTPEQETYKRFGLTQLDEAKYKELRYEQHSNEQRRIDIRKDLGTKFIDSIYRNDPKDTTKIINQYIMYDGDVNTLVASVQNEMIKGKLPPETLQAVKAQTAQAVLRAKRMKDLVGEFNH